VEEKEEREEWEEWMISRVLKLMPVSWSLVVVWRARLRLEETVVGAKYFKDTPVQLLALHLICAK
jgi:hypothetical protein